MPASGDKDQKVTASSVAGTSAASSAPASAASATAAIGLSGAAVAPKALGSVFYPSNVVPILEQLKDFECPVGSSEDEELIKNDYLLFFQPNWDSKDLLINFSAGYGFAPGAGKITNLNSFLAAFNLKFTIEIKFLEKYRGLKADREHLKKYCNWKIESLIRIMKIFSNPEMRTIINLSNIEINTENNLWHENLSHFINKYKAIWILLLSQVLVTYQELRDTVKANYNHVFKALEGAIENLKKAIKSETDINVKFVLNALILFDENIIFSPKTGAIKKKIDEFLGAIKGWKFNQTEKLFPAIKMGIIICVEKIKAYQVLKGAEEGQRENIITELEKLITNLKNATDLQRLTQFLGGASEECEKQKKGSSIAKWLGNLFDFVNAVPVLSKSDAKEHISKNASAVGSAAAMMAPKASTTAVVAAGGGGTAAIAADQSTSSKKHLITAPATK